MIMKVIIYKSNVPNDNFQNLCKETIAEKSNSYFINVESKLTAKIPSSNTKFEFYLPNITTSILSKPPNEEELKDAFLA